MIAVVGTIISLLFKNVKLHYTMRKRAHEQKVVILHRGKSLRKMELGKLFINGLE